MDQRETFIDRIGAGRAPFAHPASQIVGPAQADLDALATLEAAGVTLLGAARQRGEGPESALDFGDTAVGVLRAAQCQDEAHYHFLRSIGATPRTISFILPADALVDLPSLLRTLASLESIAVAAHMALARQATEIGDSTLVEVAFQMGAVDAQHEALARILAGALPANTRAFARWRFVAARDAADALADLGFGDGGDGEDTEEGAVAFPGPLDRLCAGVSGLVPETTADALRSTPPVGTQVPP